MDSRIAMVLLVHVFGIRISLIEEGIAYFGDATSFYLARESELKRVMGEKEVDRLLEYRRKVDFEILLQTYEIGFKNQRNV